MLLRKLQQMKAKKGFTLVELIVVIAIIAILAAILIPILVNHVRNSRCSSAIADAKSAHNVVADYVTDALTQGLVVADGDYDDDDPVTVTGGTDFDAHGITGVEVTVSGTTITAKNGDHVFPFTATNTGACDNPKCTQVAP